MIFAISFNTSMEERFLEILEIFILQFPLISLIKEYFLVFVESPALGGI